MSMSQQQSHSSDLTIIGASWVGEMAPWLSALMLLKILVVSQHPGARQLTTACNSVSGDPMSYFVFKDRPSLCSLGHPHSVD